MQEENPILNQYDECKEDTQVLRMNNKYKIPLVFSLSILLLAIVLVYAYRYTRPFSITHSIKPEESLKVPVCVDSDSQCRNKSNGVGCETGVWCDDLGEVCGGQSCVGLGLGKCSEEKCISAVEYEDTNKNKDEVERYQYNFCGDSDYCSMSKMCSNVPNGPGACVSDEDCVKQWLCGRARELMGFGMNILFEHINVVPGETRTRLGYVLIKNTENTDKSVLVKNIACFNYEGSCDEEDLIFPNSFSVERNDVVIFPIYINNDNTLNGRTSFEFTFQFGEKSSMFGIDAIFNGEKVCILGGGELERSEKSNFEEESKVDWLKKCE